MCLFHSDKFLIYYYKIDQDKPLLYFVTTLITVIVILTEVTNLGMVPGRVTCHSIYDTVLVGSS